MEIGNTGAQKPRGVDSTPPAAYLMVFTSIIPPSSYFIFLLFYKNPLHAMKSEEEVGSAEERKTEKDAGT